ncbi:hypothetical protein PN499_00145 [Kamptonema animale CS-326]|jgi:hypothetical protein|uniref:hypothetical protein n=1 Tax=Kamptonema animale TaxID=92934 RepID=UPI00232A8DC9|nr:hypothetical protein [Kamptonema animale]MDB9509615.1 hypothetical protein [Kamptonema animale CS-326]
MQLLKTGNREDFMIDRPDVQSDGSAEFETLISEAKSPVHCGIGINDPEILIATPEGTIGGSEFRLPVTPPACVRLALEDLKCFEVVESQFEHCGVTFANAVAIQPSNPAFSVSSGVTVLMGAPKSGLIEVTFKHPVRFVSGLVTSSRRTVLSARDRAGNVITEDELPAPNLAGFNSRIPPNAKLIVKAPNIYQVTFYAFDGQLIVDDFSFGF